MGLFFADVPLAPTPGAVLVLSGELPNGGTFAFWRTAAKIPERMRAEIARRNQKALDEMIALARSRAPVDTGRLLNGITGSRRGDFFEFRASAISPRGAAEDYARFEEFGHAVAGNASVSGGQLVADENFFAGSGHWRRPRVRGGDVPAYPFFFESAAEALAGRGTPAEILDAATRSIEAA